MKILFPICLFGLFSSCTITITNCDTHGYANDLVDETATTSPDVDASLSVPLKAM